jgi:hypothetical protein
MRYTVTWLRGAQNHLAQVWVDAPDKQAVTLAADAIDRELAVAPDQKGSPVSEGLRTLYIPPLHVLFSVREADRLVEVASVRSDFSPPASAPDNGETETTP